uniref:Xylulose kinase-1 n=1 Tax=Tanacetum cinerariifolium TaxID=118510 RepID=A0A6L2JUM0_TANCI|nr:hypothetical protein [Tanacetum cinerariifolium]
MVAYLSKSDASEGFDQIMDFLNAHTIQYALVVNPTIYVSCIKQFWATATVKKVNNVVQLRALIDGKKVVVSEDIIRRDLHLDDAYRVKCFPNEEIFEELTRMGYEKPPPKLTFYKACSMASAVICLATDRKFNLSKYIFDSMVRNVDSPSKFLMYPRFLQVVLDNQVDDMSTYNIIYTSPTLTQKVFSNMRRVEKGFSSVRTPLFASMLVQPQPQAKEEEEEEEVEEQPTTPHESSILLLTTLLETCATLSQKVAELEQDKHSQALEILQLKKRVKNLEKKKKSKSSGFKRLRKIEAIDANKDITLVDVEKDEKVVSMDAEPQGRINQEEVNAASKGVSATEQTIFDDEENMAGYKMEHFRGMTYDKVIPIFEREYKKVQTLFKPDKDAQEPQKKRVADETLLQESFKKLRAAKVSGFDKEDLVSLWNLVKEKFSSVVPSEDKKKALWVELKRLFESDANDVLWKLQRYMHDPLTWKLYIDCEVHHVSLTRGHDIFMLTEKDYPLSNAVMFLMLSGKLQVKKDNEMAKDLVMKIFMEANKPKSRNLKKMHKGINAAGSSITVVGSKLVLLDKVDTAPEVLKNLL